MEDFNDADITDPQATAFTLIRFGAKAKAVDRVICSIAAEAMEYPLSSGRVLRAAIELRLTIVPTGPSG
jgi:hypothetical protein